jgi:protein kinase-like protein
MLIQRGTIVGRYRIEGILGRGGMAVVYSARHVNVDRQVALKVLAEDLSSSPEFVDRFRREGRLQASLDHPHAVTVYEAGESEHGLYLAMQLVPGPTLALLFQERALDADRGLALLGQVGDALDAAHAAGLVHRDVKPQNVLVGDSEDAYLGDFGLVRDGAAGGFTSTGRLMGTIAYLAPEVIEGNTALPASDRYAFAAMTFECLTGSVVYPRGTEAAMLYAHTSDPPPSASGRRPELPASLDEVFAKALAKDPGIRPESARRLIDDVGDALDEAETKEFGPPPLWPAGLDAATAETPVRMQVPAPTARRRILPWVAGAAMAGAAVALGIGALVGGDAGRAEAAIPPPLPNSRVLGSTLEKPGRTLDCRGHTPRPASPECTIVQIDLPGATLVVPEDGVIRRWGVRSARGELSLAVLRPREGSANQIARSEAEFVENDGVYVFPTELAVERGDLVGVVLIAGGSGLGFRPIAGATTERWIPHLSGGRLPEFPPGHGFDDEILLRVEYVPAGEPRLPHQVNGPAAAPLPAGRVVLRRRVRFTGGRPVEIDLVKVGSRYVLDDVLEGKRTARIDLPGFRADGQMITFDVTPSGGLPGNVEIYMQYVGLESSRIRSHFYGADAHAFEYVN